LYIYEVKLTLEKLTIFQLQWLVWFSVCIIIFISLLPMDGIAQSAIYAVLSTGFYALIIYGNISLLYPFLYLRNQKLLYVIGVLLLLGIAGAGRGFFSWFIYYTYFSEAYKPFNYGLIFNYFIASMLIFMLSFIFRIALAYFMLKKQNENILLLKSKAELNLLKSQVRPHFLFNTLNNIYYEAYLEAPRTALLIEKLAEIMRYMVDDNSKEKVALVQEVQFLENYIALEQIRILHPVSLEFNTRYTDDLQLPPMLLITFVENIFKHGIDKSSKNNTVQLTLIEQNGYLHFTAVNSLNTGNHIKPQGSGLDNLRQRLTLLYGANFEMTTKMSAISFKAYFKIPLD
jgi:sensor histidine kinase YesM